MAKLLPTFLKNMSLVRICFGFDDDVCGRIVMGDRYGDLVLKLPARRAYYSADGKLDLMFTTNLDGRVEQFIKPSMRPNHYNIFDLLKSKGVVVEKPSKEDKDKTDLVKVVPEPPSGKVPKSEFNMVSKSREDIIKENCSKIPNFVPWHPVK
jgi:S-DNA-T family DNA segregation ATPase FtsK/SpoIIIE